MVYASSLGSHPATIVPKYFLQWIRTARILRQEKPDTVFVMTPPVFAALPVFWYAWRRNKKVVLDAHSAALVMPRWRWFQWLQRALCLRAATTLVHNEHIARHVRNWGANATLVPDVPILFPSPESFQRPAGFVVAAVCSFNYDEPIAAIVEAARQLPDVRFFVTGNPRHLDREVAAALPDNVQLTGFLSTALYGGLLIAADAVLTLTTRDHTMLRGAYEAIYQGTPVIVSDWPLLRDAFPEGAVHVDNTPEQIAKGVRRIQGDPALYREGAQRMRAAKLRQWQSTREQIASRISAQTQQLQAT